MKKRSIQSKVNDLPEFEIAEILLGQSPRRLANILRIIKNRKFSTTTLPTSQHS